MPYLIYVAESSTFSILPENLAEKLREEWSTVEVKKNIGDTLFPLEWWLEINGNAQFGKLQNDFRTVFVDGYPETVAQFVVWYAQLIGQDDDVFITHDSADVDIRVQAGSSIEQIINDIMRL